MYLILDIIQDLQREGSLYSESKRGTSLAASPAQPPGRHILHTEGDPLSVIYKSGMLEKRQNSDVSALQAGPLSTTQLLKLTLQAVAFVSKPGLHSKF